MNAGNAQTGYTCSLIGIIISSIFLVLGAVWFVFAILLAAAGAV